MERDSCPIELRVRCLGEQYTYDACFICDGAHYQHTRPEYIVSMAVCIAPSSLRANWVHKYPVQAVCDPGFNKGTLLGEAGAVHAAMSVFHRAQSTIHSALIVSDSEEFFREIRLHQQMEWESGAWVNWEVDAVIYDLCGKILDVLQGGRRLVLRHKKAFADGITTRSIYTHRIHCCQEP